MTSPSKASQVGLERHSKKWPLGKALKLCVSYGATMLAHLGKIVYGAGDNKKGYARLKDNVLHKNTKVEFGIMGEECSELLKSFFQEKRI